MVRAALAATLPVEEAADMADAVRRAFALARPDGVVLLAPACSSFDMFADYAARGRAFKEEVAQLRLGLGTGGLGLPAERSRAAEEQDDEGEASSEQSSAGRRRLGAGRWERRLPRSARLVSQSPAWLMTADRSRHMRSRAAGRPGGRPAGCFGPSPPAL